MEEIEMIKNLLQLQKYREKKGDKFTRKQKVMK